ncbi:MAG: SanA/YdcF family protein [Clostridia bacterium]
MNKRSFKEGSKKMVMLMLTAVLPAIFLLASVFIINVHVQASVREKIITASEAASLDADCILVLGAAVWDGGRPSPMLEDRLLQAIALYKDGVSDRLLMSGDHGRKDYDEVNVMKQYAIDRGIPSEHVFMDHAGFSTYESLFRARDVFQVKKTIIVTQKYHLYRALYIAQRLGLEAYGVASDPRQYAGQRNREIREVLARVKDFINGMIQPKPRYLGEPIPIRGSGDLTND